MKLVASTASDGSTRTRFARPETLLHPACTFGRVVSPLRRKPLRSNVSSPPSKSGDFRLALAQERLAENAEHDRSIAQNDFTDCESRRFREQDPRQALDGNVPQLHRHVRAFTWRSQHR